LKQLHYAKRQLTCFLRDTRIRWIEASRRTALRRTANEIIKELSEAGQV